MNKKSARLTDHDVRVNQYLSLGVFCVSLAVLFPFYSNRDFYGLEVRFAYFVQEMLRTGFTLYPHNTIGPYPDYPGTGTWLIYVLAKIFGGLSTPLAFFPSVVSSAATVAVTLKIGFLHSRAYGFFAVLLLFCTFEFLMQTRTISLDTFVMLFASLSFYLAVKPLLQQAPLPLAWLLLLVCLATLMRGAIGGVITTSVASSVFLINRQWKYLLLHGSLAALVIVAIFALLLLAAFIEGGSSFVQQVLELQISQRFTESDSAFYVYFLSALLNYAISYPLAVVAILCLGAASYKSTQSRESILFFSVIAWLLIILLGMSIPGTKKMRYILPAAPAMALLAAVLLIKTEAFTSPRIRHIVLNILATLPWLSLIALIVLSQTDMVSRLSMEKPVFLTAVLAGILGIISIWSLLRLKQLQKKMLILSICAVTVLSIKYFVEEPGQARYESDRAFIENVNDYRLSKGESQLGFYGIGPDYQDLNYLVTLNSGERPVYFKPGSRIISTDTDQPMLLIIRDKYMQAFRKSFNRTWQEIDRGKLGHKKCTAVWIP